MKNAVPTERKQHILGADFVRSISTLGIIAYHFSCTILEYKSGNTMILHHFANGSWGALFVTIFFILSGAMLYYNNQNIVDLKKFYWKRWKGIFPMFYLSYLIMYIPNVIQNKSLFYMGNPPSFLLTILGMDGYFSYRVKPNYYILGEWFLGAIILLYILYPLFLKLMKKTVFCSVCFVMLYIWQVLTSFFLINDYYNLIYCGLSFWMGMLFMKNYRTIEENKKILCAISFMLVFVLIFIKLPVKSNFVIHIAGMGMFILLFFGGEIILKRNRSMNLIFSKISMISYAIFLIHHRILYKLLEPFSNMNSITTIVLLFVSFAVCFVAAYIIYFINKKITLLIRRNSHVRIQKTNE